MTLTVNAVVLDAKAYQVTITDESGVAFISTVRLVSTPVEAVKVALDHYARQINVG
jgi:hypothetical protein